MSYKVVWRPSSEVTYFDEIDFIYRKWNNKEVQKFQELVFENLSRLSENPEIGLYNKDLKYYSFLLSKQTTLYYDFDKENKIIELYLFWNNQKNPEDLAKLL